MRIKAKVHQWIDKYFPEFLDVFSNWEDKASLSTLREIPLPDQVNKLKIGDIRNYDHPRQIRKLAGLNLVENSSGKHKGKIKISKRGRPKLRSILYRVTWPLVGQNNEFKQLHEY